MNESVICAVCGDNVYMDEDYVRVQVEHKRMHDRDERDDYFLHDRCADAVFDGWWKP